MKKANPKTVGGFVVGAVILAVIAVGVFGSGRYFEERVKLVAFFPGSLQGLRAGASVQMRGIQIGKVTQIWVEFDEDTLDFTIPVVMEIQLSRIRGSDPNRESRADELIERGLRAQLVAQSLVTGQQTIQFDFHPDTPVTLAETDLPYAQVPTIPSKFSKMESSLDEVASQAGVVLAQVSDLLSEQNRANVGEALGNIASLTGELDERAKELGPILAEVGEIVSALKDDEPRFRRVLDSSNEALTSFDALAKSADKLIADNRKAIGDFANTGLYEFTNLAVDSQAAIEQFRRVMEEMERDPARFFLGRPGEVEVQ